MDLSTVCFRIFLGCVVLLGATALALLAFTARGALPPQTPAMRSGGIDATTVANIVLAVAAIGALYVSIQAWSVSQRTYAIEVQPVLMLDCRIDETNNPKAPTPVFQYTVVALPSNQIGQQVIKAFGEKYGVFAENGPQAFRCRLYNYGRTPALNVRLNFHIQLRTDTNSASPSVSYDLPIPSTSNLVPGAINVPTNGVFDFTILNMTTLNAFIIPDATATLSEIGENRDRNVSLTFGAWTFTANMLQPGKAMRPPANRNKR